MILFDEEKLDDTFTRDVAAVLLKALTPREERVIRLRFGIGLDQHYILDEVAEMFSLSRERIRQIELKAFRILARPKFRRTLWKLFDENFHPIEKNPPLNRPSDEMLALIKKRRDDEREKWHAEWRREREKKIEQEEEKHYITYDGRRLYRHFDLAEVINYPNMVEVNLGFERADGRVGGDFHTQEFPNKAEARRWLKGYWVAVQR